MDEDERDRLGRIAYEEESAYVRELAPNYRAVLWDERAFVNGEVYERMAEAVAVEVRRIDREKLERRRDAYRARADANPNAYWLDLASAFDEALEILQEE